LGKSFTSIRIIGKEMVRPVWLSFFTENASDRMGAYLACNWMAGDYRIKDGLLIWSDVLSTNMLCLDGIDDWFSSLMAKGVTATTKGSRLYLTSDQTQIILEQTAQD